MAWRLLLCGCLLLACCIGDRWGLLLVRVVKMFLDFVQSLVDTLDDTLLLPILSDLTKTKLEELLMPLRILLTLGFTVSPVPLEIKCPSVDPPHCVLSFLGRLIEYNYPLD